MNGFERKEEREKRKEGRVGIAHRVTQILSETRNITSHELPQPRCARQPLPRRGFKSQTLAPALDLALSTPLRGVERSEGEFLRHCVFATFSFLLLASCAPARATTPQAQTQVPSPTNSSIVSLVVNPNGDTVCVPSNSSMAAYFPRAAIRGQTGHSWFEAPLRIAGAAWQNGAWWLALPRGGLVQKADGVPQSVSVAGQPSFLSSRLIFTLEGDVFRFDGTRVGRLPSLPSGVVDGKNVTFAVSGKEVFSITSTVNRLRPLENNGFSVTLGSPLSTLPEEANYLVVRGVAVSQNDYTYTLEKNSVRVSTATGQFLKNIALSGNASRIAVGGDTLAVSIGSSVTFFDARSFVPLITRACEVTR